MYISSFHIDGFGILSDVTVKDLSPGLNIFLGRNEAGKSSCLEFLRAALTGFPEEGREIAEKFQPVSGARPGGSLEIYYEGPDGRLGKAFLTRRPARFGGLALQDESGNALGEERLKAALSSISQNSYRKVFGFSLSELESFDSLNEEGVLRALCGASFGPGLVPPAEALKELKSRKDALFRPGGGKAPLNSALKELEELKKEISAKESVSAGYEQLCLARDRRQEELALLSGERHDLEARRQTLQRRLSVWEQWRQWRGIMDRLGRMPALPDNFPGEAVERLAQIRAQINERESDLAAQSAKLDSLEARRAGMAANESLAGLLPALRSLAERKESYRNAISQEEGLLESVSKAREELEDILARLGSGWDCARIRATNRSLFAREDLARHEEEIRNAKLAFQAASAALESANQEASASERSCLAAREALKGLPEPEAPLSERERDELREKMGALNESRRLERSREKALESARANLERCLAQARISIDKAENDMLAAAEKALKKISASQDEASKLAEELGARLARLEGVKQKRAGLEEEEERIRKKCGEEAERRKADPPASRAALDARGRALKALRALRGKTEAVKERLQDLDERISGLPKPERTVNRILLVIGSLLLLAGGAFFAANYFWGLTEIAITGGPSLTVESWMGYLPAFCGVLLLAFGFPPNSPEKKRYERERAQLLAGRENAALRMAEYDSQSQGLFAAAGVKSMDPITIDAAEMMLEREKERLLNDERSIKEEEKLKQELRDVRARISSLQGEAHIQEEGVQRCRRQWLALMDSLGIEGRPSPESAATVLARSEAAGMALGQAQACGQELQELWEQLHILESAITSMPAIQERLDSAPLPLSLEEAVSQTLESCKEADAALEQRKMAQAALKTVEAGLAGARKRQEEASLRLEKAAAKLAEAREGWAGAAQGFGLGADLDPQILREALRLMDQALLAEEKLSRLEREERRGAKEKQAFESALQAFLSQLGEDVQEGAADWAAALDSLLAEGESAAAVMAEMRRLDSLIGERREELGAADAALESARARLRALLQKGGAENEDAFIKTARLVEERQRLDEGLAGLKSSLAAAAGKQPLEEFLEGFNEEDRESLEQRLSAIEQKLKELGGRERETAASFGSLAAKAENIAALDELASMRQDKSMLEAGIDNLARQWARLALAEGILLEAKRKFERERQPQVMRAASEIFSQITGGRWKGLKMSLEDARLEILPEYGEPLPPWKLSRGAREQAYLALRLAYIMDHARRAMPLPVIMDEILVNFDPERAARAAKAIAGMAQNPPEGKFQQVLYFTCQPHAADALRGADPGARLFAMENGAISPA